MRNKINGHEIKNQLELLPRNETIIDQMVVVVDGWWCCIDKAYLLSLNVFPAFPLDETGTPVLDHVRLTVFTSLAFAETALRSDGGHSVHL